uniref:F-box protein 40 n=1 Tax=Oryzias melastigma TaxID=30732 RepID=A0A3B3B4H1_ORYME
VPRLRPSAAGLGSGHHEHCDKCFSTRCQVLVKTSRSCTVTRCPRSCGAVLHVCKLEEHSLLCPNETVPCLNAFSGCSITMPRKKLAKHLEVCPASVVCCSQEWNRWPVSDTNVTFYRRVSEKLQSDSEAGLDVALALRDQALLFQSIKMKHVFPEMMAEELQMSAAGEPACSSDFSEFTENGCAEEREEERCDLAESGEVASLQNYSSWEKVFRKEMEGCNQTVKNLNRQATGKKEQETSKDREEMRDDENAVASRGTNGVTGLAPWQDGVLDRLCREANIAEYNMYLVHNGAMLINFGQLAACTPREKDFVYGNLEPIEVKTVRTYKIPTSFRAKRIDLKDPACKAKTTHQCVDTADLGFSVEDLPKSDEVSSTLLCSLEKELKGHIISASGSSDGLYEDVGTQTHSFPSAPFRADASLADVVTNKHPGLLVNVEVESVTRRHNRTSSVFSYECGQFFRRDEFPSHSRNAHCDIQAQLNGWFQQRCPLAYLGCTFTQTRFHPAGQQATIKFDKDINAMALQPLVPSSLCESDTGRNAARNPDVLSSLPLEILQNIAAHLDSFTLSQLSLVSHLMREVCASLLQHRGMVFLQWTKKTYSHGGTSWKCHKKVSNLKISSYFFTIFILCNQGVKTRSNLGISPSSLPVISMLFAMENSHHSCSVSAAALTCKPSLKMSFGIIYSS